MPEQIDKVALSYDMGGGKGNRMSAAFDSQFDSRGFRNNSSFVSNDYAYDANGSMTRDGTKSVNYTYNALNKVERQAVGAGSLVFDYDASGTVVRKVTTAATTKTEYYVDGFVYESSPSFTGLRSVPTPEGRAVAVQPGDTKLTYEYHLRDHLGNLRVAFRAQAGTEDLKLSSELSENEGNYPQFGNLVATRNQDGAAMPTPYGNIVARTTSASPGPVITIPVSHQDHLKVRVHYKTPYGFQYFSAAPAPTPVAARIGPAIAWAIAPALLPAPRRGEHPGPVVPGVQVRLAGLLSHWVARPRQAPVAAYAAAATTTTADAYLNWTLTNAKGTVVRTGRAVAPVTPQSGAGYASLDLPLDIDLSSEDARTGTLRIQEMNDGSQAVYFDSLTITHPQDRALVSQENHYYPFGMALTGVALTTTAQHQVSKDQFNGGSQLQDDLLDGQTGIYSTFYRNYDPTTGRFLGVDPLAHKFADSSPYAFGFNDPMNFNDPHGDEPIFINGQLMNPRDIATGQEVWTGSALDLTVYQQGGTGVTTGAGDLVYRNGQWGTFVLDSNNGTGQYKFVPTPFNEPGEFQISQAPAWRSSMGATQGIDWENFGNNFIIGATTAGKSNMHSASAFAGYAGLPVAKNEALLKYISKTSTSWADKAFALKAVRGFAVTGKALGIIGVGLTVFGDMEQHNVGWGTLAKIGIGALSTRPKVIRQYFRV